MKDLSYLKIISLITIIIFFWSNIVLGGPVEGNTLRVPLKFGPGGEKRAAEIGKDKTGPGLTEGGTVP